MSMRAHKQMGVLIPSAPVCALGQLPLISKGSLCPHPARLRRATFPRGEGFGERIVTVGILLPKNVLVREHPKAPLADQGELSRASPASTRLRGSEFPHCDNPSVMALRETAMTA